MHFNRPFHNELYIFVFKKCGMPVFIQHLFPKMDGISYLEIWKIYKVMIIKYFNTICGLFAKH